MSEKGEDMFRVVAEITNRKDPETHIDVVMKTEKFYEFLGRYLYKYGPPVVVEVTHGTSEYEYSKEINGVNVSAIVSFAKVAEAKKERSTSSSFQRSRPETITRPAVPVTPPPPKPEFAADTAPIAAMQKAGFLEEVDLTYSHHTGKWSY